MNNQSEIASFLAMTNKLTSNIDTSADRYRPPLSDRFNEHRTTNNEQRTMNNQSEIASILRNDE